MLGVCERRECAWEHHVRVGPASREAVLTRAELCARPASQQVIGKILLLPQPRSML